MYVIKNYDEEKEIKIPSAERRDTKPKRKIR